MSSIDLNRRVLAVAAGCMLLASTAQAQQRPGQKEVPRGAIAAAPAGWKAPRLPDGTPDISGAWETSVTGMPLRMDPAVAAALPKRDPQPPFVPGGEEIWVPKPINGVLPDPVVEGCMPNGVPRIMTAPYPMRIFQSKDAVAILFEQTMTFRLIYTDGRPHPEDMYNWRWMGHSIGRWEGDTLIIDTAGQTAPTWISAQGNRHSDALRVIERLTVVAPGALSYDVTLDDPKVFTKPWIQTVKLYQAKPDGELWEYFCEENKTSHEWTGRPEESAQP